MKTKLFLMCVMAASAAYIGAAMPTEAEVEKAVPKVERMLASEKAALASGKMTRAEVAEAAMKLAAGADDEAAKLLLMKGAFILHVKDGDLEKAVKTMNALETAIADMPPQIIPTFHVRKQNPSGCWGFARRSSLHSRFCRVGSFA